MAHAHIQATINRFLYCFIDKLTAVIAAIAFSFRICPIAIVHCLRVFECECECIGCNSSEAFDVFEQLKFKPKVSFPWWNKAKSRTHAFIHSRLTPLPSDASTRNNNSNKIILATTGVCALSNTTKGNECVREIVQCLSQPCERQCHTQ